MKRPGYIMSVYVIARVNADGSINFNEFKDEGKPLWFRLNVFAEGTIYVKEIGGKLEFRKMLMKAIQ